VAIACQLDAHIPIKSIALRYIPGFAEATSQAAD
jgi:hypothetical protein